MEKSEGNLDSTDTHTPTSVTFSGMKKRHGPSHSHFRDLRSSPTLISEINVELHGKKENQITNIVVCVHRSTIISFTWNTDIFHENGM